MVVLFFPSPTFLQAMIEIVMGKRFSSFAGLNFGVWVSFEKMGHTGFGGGGVDVRTKNVGIWLWGWVLFLSLFPLIPFLFSPLLQDPHVRAVFDELHACYLLFLPPMRFYISRVLGYFYLFILSMIVFLFGSAIPCITAIRPNIPPRLYLFLHFNTFQPALQRIKNGRTWYLIFTKSG
ncbi:hypothetical protein HOY80DRAFT_489809 [Tuber brumale]|nr:hypothetical protein HOY80DRAFT_489809 [Tuber brumale]